MAKTETAYCLTCEEPFQQHQSSYMHTNYCDDCGDPREGYESWDDQLAGKIAYQDYLKYGTWDL